MFNGTVSALDGTRYGTCCIKDDMIGCAVDSDCCSSNYRCDDIGFCRAVSSGGSNVAGTLAMSLRNDREAMMAINKNAIAKNGSGDEEERHRWMLFHAGLVLMLLIVATACFVGLMPLCFRRRKGVKVADRDEVGSEDADDEFGDETENEWNSMLRWAMKKSDV